VIAKAKSLKPSARGELEITDINNLYLQEGKLDVKIYKDYWLDTGTFDALLEAGNTIAKLRKNGK
jgi:glucose-1-phosphate thymidylyltransferase